jgi:hypothetical protein
VIRAILAIIVVVLTTSAPSQAQDHRQRYQDALALMDTNKFAEALPIFEEVAIAIESPNAQLYVGRCLRELGRHAEAYDALTLAVRWATARASTEAKYGDTLDAAASERAALEPKIALVTIVVARPPEGLMIALQGRPVDVEQLGQPIAVMPGTHSVEARAMGHDNWARSVSVSAGDTETVTIQLDVTAQDPGGPVAPEQSEIESSGGELRVVGYVVAGLGVAGWITFVAAGVSADNKYDDLFDECGGTRCTDSAKESDVDGGRTLDTIANVGLVIGIVGTVAGAGLIIFGGPSETSEARLDLGPGGITLRGHF